MAVLEETPITEPGLHDISAEAYHRDPVAGGSLSSHGARKLLACPALYHHNRYDPEEAHKAAYDEGTIAHLLVLGAGDARVAVVNSDDWKPKAAQQARKDAYAAGKVPVLAGRYARIERQAEALHAHPLAASLLKGGRAEQVFVWRDEATGVWCRGMADCLQPHGLIDYKTTDDADPYACRKAIARLGYHIQEGHYRDGAAALGLGVLPFWFIFQMKAPPFLVTVLRIDREFREAGHARARRAREMYRDCTAAGVWPGYVPETEFVTVAAPWRLNTEE